MLGGSPSLNLPSVALRCYVYSALTSLAAKLATRAVMLSYDIDRTLSARRRHRAGVAPTKI